MKKLVITAASLAMLASLPMTALAASDTIEEKPGSQTIEVQAKYVDGVTTQDVYSVDVEWGAMEFTYNVSGSKIWKPADHTYEVTPTEGWTAYGNTVTVINHSNQPVDVAFSFDKDAAVTEEITGSFDTSTATLAAGKEGQYAQADSVKATLTLGGALGSDKTTLTKVGKITVQLS
jgi:hypothetical protein